MERILNEESDWNNTLEADAVLGQVDRISIDEVLQIL